MPMSKGANIATDPTTGRVSQSPDIIVRQAAVTDPQGTYGAGSGTENDPRLSQDVAGEVRAADRDPVADFADEEQPVGELAKEEEGWLQGHVVRTQPTLTDPGRDVDPEVVVGHDLQLGQQVDPARGGDCELDDPQHRVPDRQAPIDLLQHRVHQETDGDDREARDHREEHPHRRSRRGLTILERLDGLRTEHVGDHLDEEQDSDRDRSFPL